MVHTDEDVAAFGQGLDAVLQHIEFFFAAGNGFGIDAALRLEDMRQVGVVIKGKAVGIERQDSVDGGFNAFGGLVRQTVNQIDADGFESGFAGGIDDFFGFVVRTYFFIMVLSIYIARTILGNNIAIIIFAICPNSSIVG